MQLVLALLVLAAPQEPGHARFQGAAMGSDLEIEVFGSDRDLCDRAVKAAREEIGRLEKIMTDWSQDSPLMDVNRAAGSRPVEAPPELYFIVERSLKISELTEGAFDITFAAAGKLWNWRDPRLPTPEEVKAALADVGWKGVRLDEKARTIHLTRPGMKIGLGAIGPGYAGDRAMDRIRALGIRNACVNMSGDVRVIGKKNGGPWTVGVTHPRKKGESIAVLPVTNAGVSTSGDYERYFEKDGKRYCHIIDPRTGYPADQCQSVTVVAPNLAFADGLATGIFVLGPRKGMELIEKLEGVHALIVDSGGALHVSKGLMK